MKDLLPPKAFAYVEGSDKVPIFDDETRNYFIERKNNKLAISDRADDEMNLRPMSYKEFKALFSSGDNNMYTTREKYGEVVYGEPCCWQAMVIQKGFETHISGRGLFHRISIAFEAVF